MTDLLHPEKTDFHMHTTVSDGTDTPAEILARVKEAGIPLFAVTDHDAVKGCVAIIEQLREGDPAFITGVEFSCRDEEGKYHILGYGYDPEGGPVQGLTEKAHGFRMEKVRSRLSFLESEFGFAFPEEELEELLSLDNPGKPHIGNLMVKHGYAENKDIAIKEYINRLHIKSKYIRPEEAIRAILESGGIPVLAHPLYGSGDEWIEGDVMEHRLQKLQAFGLQGVEAFYSGFLNRHISEMLAFAERFHFYITAGSDYHGTNKIVQLGDTNLDKVSPLPEGFLRFLEATKTEGLWHNS